MLGVDGMPQGMQPPEVAIEVKHGTMPVVVVFECTEQHNLHNVHDARIRKGKRDDVPLERVTTAVHYSAVVFCTVHRRVVCG